MLYHKFLSAFLSFALLLSSFPNYLWASSNPHNTLDNALAGLQLVSLSGKVDLETIETFNRTHAQALKDRGLDQKFLKLEQMLKQFGDCGSLNNGVDLPRSYANSLFAKISTCEDSRQTRTEEVARLLGDIDKIVANVEKKNLDLPQEKIEKLAAKIYQEQRKMYVGTAYLAYSNYREPGISLDAFLESWEKKAPKATMPSMYDVEVATQAAAPIHQVLEVDKFWQADFEKESQKAQADGEKMQRLVAQGTSQLREINKNFQELNEIEAKQLNFEAKLSQLHNPVVPHKEDQGVIALTRALEDPFEQGFTSYMRMPKSPMLDSKLPLDGIDEDVARRRREAHATYELYENNIMLADYVKRLKQNFAEKGIELQVVNDVVSHNFGQQMQFNSAQTKSSLDLLSEYGIDEKTRSKFEYQLQNEIYSSVSRSKPRATVASYKMNLSDVLKLHDKMMKESVIASEVESINLRLGSEWVDQYGRLEQSRKAARSGDTAFLVYGANAGRFVGGHTPGTVMSFESNAGTRNLSLYRGLGKSEKDLAVDEANKMLDSFFEESRKLTEMINEKYSTLTPEEYLKDVITYHPALVNQIVADDPDSAAALCILAKKSQEDEANEAKWDERVASIGAIVSAGAIFLTAGLATPIVVGVGVVTAAYGMARYTELANEAEFASATLGATGQVKGREGEQGKSEVAQIQAKALANFQAAALDGTLTAWDLRKVAKVLPLLEKGGETWQALAESKKHVKTFAQSLKTSEPYKKLADDYLQNEVKNEGKGVILKDEEELK